MKKILLATTALGVLISASALAEGPTVTIGGNSNFQVGYGANSHNFRPINSTYSQSTHSRNDTKIDLKVDGKGDNGLGYGALVELQADTNANDSYSNNGG